jgi:FMN phosphatase YigB (HAD superfamily)
MHALLKGVEIVGFDLDGTLYPFTKDSINPVRTEIAKKILDKKPELETIDNAREYFESRYEEIESGSRILEEAGYKNGRLTMDECLANADIIPFIKNNTLLASYLEILKLKRPLFLLTNSPEDLSISKLEKIGIHPETFHYRIYGDSHESITQNNGKPFEAILRRTSLEGSQHAYVGDRKDSDITPAKRLGMKTIAVHSNIPEADISLPNINDIRNYLL